jgi:acetylcholinesterase
MRASVFLALSACAAAAQAAMVALGGTTLLGTAIPTFQQDFAGIPFAEPPVGALRLRPPVLKTHLNVATFNATNYGASCIQIVRASAVSSAVHLLTTARSGH